MSMSMSMSAATLLAIAMTMTMVTVAMMVIPAMAMALARAMMATATISMATRAGPQCPHQRRCQHQCWNGERDMNICASVRIVWIGQLCGQTPQTTWLARMPPKK
jgi:hypothetical protein